MPSAESIRAPDASPSANPRLKSPEATVPPKASRPAAMRKNTSAKSEVASAEDKFQPHFEGANFERKPVRSAEVNVYRERGDIQWQGPAAFTRKLILRSVHDCCKTLKPCCMFGLGGPVGFYEAIIA